MLITFYLNLMAGYNASPTNCSMCLSIVEIKYLKNIIKMQISMQDQSIINVNNV